MPDTLFARVAPYRLRWLHQARAWNGGRGGFVMFTRESEDGMTIRSHRCREPRGEFSYQGGESAP
jgi:hypothetical protein